MARWMKPEEEYPNVECGDRIVCIVMCRRERWQKDLAPMVVILEATEKGWIDPEDSGYAPEDAVCWTTEKDLCQIAHVLG